MSERRSIVPVTRALLPTATLAVERALRGTPYLDGAIDALDFAVGSPGADDRAMAIARDDRIEGVIVFGFFGGTNRAGRLHVAVVDPSVRRMNVGRTMTEDAIARLHAEGARFVLAELPDDPRALPGAREFLESLRFREESRIESFYRDGVALSFMRRELGAE